MSHLLTILIIFVWPFGQLLQLTPIGSPIRFQLLDLLTFLLALSLLVSKNSRQLIKADRLTRPVLFFVLSLFVSLAFNAVTSIAWLYLLRFVSYLSIYYSFAIRGVKKYSGYLFLSITIFLSIGFLQYLFLPDTRFLSYSGFDDHYFRLIGSLLDPNFTGLVLVVFTLLFPLPIRLIPLLALALTFSRISFLALAFGLLYIGIARRQIKPILILGLLFLLIILAPKPFGEGVNLLRTFSISSRIENQINSFNNFSQAPLFGHGFDTLNRRVDNSFLYVLATSGIFGLITFLTFLKFGWSLNLDVRVRASLLAILIHSLANNSFFYPWILSLYFVLLNLKFKK